MIPDNSDYFDFYVVGQVAYDHIETSAGKFERWGGVFYAASAFAKFSNRVGVSAVSGTPQIATARDELSRRGIHADLVSIGKESIEFFIKNGDELLPQSTSRLGPRLDSTTPHPAYSLPSKTGSTLLYPLTPMHLNSIAAILRNATEKVLAVDLQHDISDIQEAAGVLDLFDVIFLNESSLRNFFKVNSIEDALLALRRMSPKSIVVVKMGLKGSLVALPSAETLHIPAFKSNFKCTVGAGDAYDAAFLQTVSHSADLNEAGLQGALLAAHCIENEDQDPSSGFDSSICRTRILLDPRGQRPYVYIAGHFHSDSMRLFLENICAILENTGIDCYLPHRDGGVIGVNGVTRKMAFDHDIAGLDKSDIVIGAIDGAHRGGTYFELGYAHAHNKPTIIICTDKTMGISNMIFGSSFSIVRSKIDLINDVMDVCTRL